MSKVGDTFAKGWMLLGTRFLPFADAATKELPLGRLMRLSLFQVSVGISDRVAQRHAQSRDDRRTQRLDVVGFIDGLAAAGVRAVPRADRVQVGQSPLGARLAARALHLARHDDAVWWLRDPAVRVAGAVGHRRMAGRIWSGRGGARVPDDRRGHAYNADGGPCARDGTLRRKTRGRALLRSCM